MSFIILLAPFALTVLITSVQVSNSFTSGHNSTKHDLQSSTSSRVRELDLLPVLWGKFLSANRGTQIHLQTAFLTPNEPKLVGFLPSRSASEARADRLLLQRAGDVVVNPGPTRWPCPKFSRSAKNGSGTLTVVKHRTNNNVLIPLHVYARTAP